jgi:hypothetical protein
MQAYLDKILNFPLISRVRRNHALEHATLQVLGKKNPKLNAAGYSDPQGFLIVGDVSTDLLRESVNEALRRLLAGEEHLAIHPACGTNFVSTGVVAGTLGWLAMLGADGKFGRKLERWPFVVMLVTIGAIVAQPLGPLLQAKFTTDADVGELEVTAITRFEREGTPVHRVKTAN